jgi:hypothetical protein
MRRKEPPYHNMRYLWDEKDAVYHDLLSEHPKCDIDNIPIENIRMFENTVDLGLYVGGSAVAYNRCPHCAD